MHIVGLKTIISERLFQFCSNRQHFRLTVELNAREKSPGAGSGEAGGHDGATGRAVAAAAPGPGQALDPREVLRELLAVPLLLRQLHLRPGRALGQALVLGHQRVLVNTP